MIPEPTGWRRRASPLLLAALCGLSFPFAAARAELPVEQLTTQPLPPADSQRLYLTDPVMGHLVDGRLHVIDGARMKYLGVIGTGFSASTVLSPDRRHLYVATTYHSRLQRGTRTDVVEVYRTDDLTFEHEIEIPPKHAQGLQIRALMQPSADGRFLLIQNATPATSVTVVDLEARKVTAEIANPGCWGVLPWPQQPTRYSTVCGDGTLQTFDLTPEGAAAGNQRSARFFDPDQDPVFMHYDMKGPQVTMLSFYGTVHRFELKDEAPRFAPTWSLLNAQDRKQGWRPGGFALFAVDPATDRLFVSMHSKGAEGSHKNPAEQLWTVDLNTRQRLARTPGHGAISMTLTRAPQPRLVLLSGLDNTLVSLDIRDATRMKKPVIRSEPFGETPVYLEAH